MIRRAWRVLADPPASDLAAFMRNFALPLSALLFPARLFVHPALGPGLTELVWMAVVLVVVRQRDAARAAVIDSPAVHASGHQHSSDRPPATATAPPAPHSAITTRHRNETP